MIIIAVLGPTASGKSDLAIALAKRLDAHILSLDSLAIYKGFDIASAKSKDLGGIRHFALSIKEASEHVSLASFVDELECAIEVSRREGRRALILAGGSSFYLKGMLDGVCEFAFDMEGLDALGLSQKSAHAMLVHADSGYLVPSHDSYRIQRDVNILLKGGMPPREYFIQHKRRPLFEKERFVSFCIDIDKGMLWQRIEARARAMLEAGLVDEVASELCSYKRGLSCYSDTQGLDSGPALPQPFGAIGVKEALAYLDDASYPLLEKLVINTRRLAKRQKTFNKTQLKDLCYLPFSEEVGIMEGLLLQRLEVALS